MLRFAIIGCGTIAGRHAGHIATRGKLVAVCDIIEEKAVELGARYQATPYTSIDALLESEKEVDVVCVCTPNGLHAQHSIKALRAGAHVLCEKPMALTIQDCRNMMQAEEEAKKQLFIVKQNRFNPPVVAVKKVLDEGRLGKLFSIQLNCFWNRDAAYYHNSWKGTQLLDGGTLFTQFSHFIDLLCWMIGDVKQVKGLLANYHHQGIIEFEDTGVLAIEFVNGIMGAIHYTVNSYHKNMEGSLTLFGEKGTVKIGGQYLNELEYQDIEGYVIDNLPAGKPANNYGTYQGSMSNHGKVYDNLVAVLNGTASMTTTAAEGLKTVAVIEKIYKEAIRL